MTDKTFDFWKRLKQFDYRSELQFWHDTILAGNYVNIANTIQSNGGTLTFIVPDGQTLFVTDFICSSLVSMNVLFTMGGTNVYLLQTETGVFIDLPIKEALVGDGIRTVIITNNAAAGTQISVNIWAYLENTVKNQINVTRA